MTIGQFETNVLSIKKLNDLGDVREIELKRPEGFKFVPGQYLSLSVISDGKKYRKPLSIASGKNENTIKFCVKIIPDGMASEYIKTLKSGDRVELLGPIGNFTIKDKNIESVFISHGVGIAPFMSMIPEMEAEKILIQGVRDDKSLFYEEEIKSFGGRIVYSKNGNYVQDVFENLIPKNFKGNFYICGLKKMIEESIQKLKSLGFQEDNIFYEQYD